MSFSHHLSVRHCVRLSVLLLQSDTKFRHLIREKVKQRQTVHHNHCYWTKFILGLRATCFGLYKASLGTYLFKRNVRDETHDRYIWSK